MRARAPILTVATLLLLAVPAGADVLLLKDGRIIEREKMETAEGGVKVHFENGDVLIPKDQIQEAVLAAAPPEIPDTPEAKEKAAKGLVPFEGKWVKPEQRDEAIQKRIAAKRAAVEEVRKHSLWRDRYMEETKHFKFEYTVAPHVFPYFRDLMEAYYEEFAKTWKVKQPKDLGKLTVCFYTDRDSFTQTGGAGGGVEGYFRFVPPLELNFYFSRLDPYHTEQVMYHEANHYLQLLLRPDFDMPHFPGEALAEYYGASRFDPATKKITTGHVLEGRLAEIQGDVARGEMLGLKKMLESDRMYEHYNWGWSLVHYLMNDKRYAKKFETFVKELVVGKDVKRSRDGPNNMETVKQSDVYAHFTRCLDLRSDAAVQALEAEWHAYVKDELKLVTANGLELGGTSAMRSGRPIKAKRLFKEAIEKGTTNPLTYYRYGDLLADDGKWDEAIPLFRKAIELEPLEGRFYLKLGAALVRKGDDKAEAARMAKLALELSPDDWEVDWSAKRLLEEIEKGEPKGS